MLGMGPGERWRTSPAVGEARAGWRARGRWGRWGGECVQAAGWGGVARGVHHLPLKWTNRDEGYHGDLRMRVLFPMWQFDMKTTEIWLTRYRLSQSPDAKRWWISLKTNYLPNCRTQYLNIYFVADCFIHFLIRPMAGWKKLKSENMYLFYLVEWWQDAGDKATHS